MDAYPTHAAAYPRDPNPSSHPQPSTHGDQDWRGERQDGRGGAGRRAVGGRRAAVLRSSGGKGRGLRWHGWHGWHVCKWEGGGSGGSAGGREDARQSFSVAALCKLSSACGQPAGSAALLPPGQQQRRCSCFAASPRGLPSLPLAEGIIPGGGPAAPSMKGCIAASAPGMLPAHRGAKQAAAALRPAACNSRRSAGRQAGRQGRQHNRAAESNCHAPTHLLAA